MVMAWCCAIMEQWCTQACLVFYYNDSDFSVHSERIDIDNCMLIAGHIKVLLFL